MAAAEAHSQCSGDSFKIDLAGLEGYSHRQSHSERLEQLRDWIWLVLRGRLEATSRIDGLLIGNATQPLVRDDASRPRAGASNWPDALGDRQERHSRDHGPRGRSRHDRG